MLNKFLLVSVLVAPSVLLAAKPVKTTAPSKPATQNVSTQGVRLNRSALKGLNPFVSYLYQAVDLKKRNNSVKEMHSNLQTNDFKGLNLGLGMEHHIAGLDQINLASRVHYQYGRDSEEAKVNGVDVDTMTTEHVFKFAEALQYNIGMNSGVLRPTVELGLGYARIHDELNAGGKNSVEANGTSFLVDVAMGADFKFNNGFTPFLMGGYRNLSVSKKDMKVSGTGQFQNAESTFDYQLSGLAFNAGVGYTF